MKKLFCSALLFVMLLSLTACIQTATPSDPSTEPTQSSTEPTQTNPTDPSKPISDDSYVLTVKSHDELIFDEPTYDGSCVGTVRQAGVYTIVEEATDGEGNRWGKLKSGAGWLNLDQVSKNNAANLLVTAAELTYEMDSPCLQAAEPTELSIAVIIHAYDTISNVRLYSLAWDGEAYEPAEPMYVAEKMDATQPMVAHLEFAGDMTMFGVSFQDAAGNFHHYRISTNGRNSAIDFSPYEPT